MKNITTLTISFIIFFLLGLLIGPYFGFICISPLIYLYIHKFIYKPEIFKQESKLWKYIKYDIKNERGFYILFSIFLLTIIKFIIFDYIYEGELLNDTKYSIFSGGIISMFLIFRGYLKEYKYL